MKRLFLLLLALVSISQGQNYTGVFDTSNYVGFAGTATKRGNVVPLSTRERVALVFGANDTQKTNWATLDSCKFLCGYRVGLPFLNSSRLEDTTWGIDCIADTFNALAGPFLFGQVAVTDTSTGSAVQPHGMIDTTNVKGYACLKINVCPDWGTVIQPFVRGLTGNKAVTSIKARSCVIRQQYMNVRQK
jgi:hypothetical protein